MEEVGSSWRLFLVCGSFRSYPNIWLLIYSSQDTNVKGTNHLLLLVSLAVTNLYNLSMALTSISFLGNHPWPPWFKHPPQDLLELVANLPYTLCFSSLPEPQHMRGGAFSRLCSAHIQQWKNKLQEVKAKKLSPCTLDAGAFTEWGWALSNWALPPCEHPFTHVFNQTLLFMGSRSSTLCFWPDRY